MAEIWKSKHEVFTKRVMNLLIVVNLQQQNVNFGCLINLY